MTNQPHIRVIVLTHGGAAQAGGVITELFAQGVSPSDIIVVDNHGGEVEEATSLLGCRVVARSLNDGYGAGMNAGALECGASGDDVLMFCTPDIEIQPGCVTALRDALTPTRGIVGPMIRHRDGTPFSAGGAIEHRRFVHETGSPRAFCEWVDGAMLMTRADLFDELGGFDESLFLYYEDVDLCLKARTAGYAICCIADAHIIQTPGAYQRPKLWARLSTRNRLRITRRHAGLPATAAVAMDIGWRDVLGYCRVIAGSRARNRDAVTRLAGTLQGLADFALHRSGPIA